MNGRKRESESLREAGLRLNAAFADLAAAVAESFGLELWRSSLRFEATRLRNEADAVRRQRDSA